MWCNGSGRGGAPPSFGFRRCTATRPATTESRWPRNRCPLCGVLRHLLARLQALWLFSLLVAVPVLAARWRQQHGTVHMELLSAAAAVVAHCSLLFQVKALLVFDPAAPLHSLLGGAFARGRERLAWDVGRLPSRTARAYIVTGIGLLWVGLGGALLLATEFLHDPVSLAVYYSLAAACVTTGAFTTHGLAGFLRFADPPDASSHGGGGGSPGASGTSSSGGGSTSSSGWRFFQPFQGGTAFVLAQVGAATCGGRCRQLASNVAVEQQPAWQRLAPPPTRFAAPVCCLCLCLAAGAGLGSVQLRPCSTHTPGHPGGGRGGLLVSALACSTPARPPAHLWGRSCYICPPLPLAAPNRPP